MDGSGNFYVADTFAASAPIKEFTASSGYTSATVLGSGFDQPAGVAVDGAGNVYVADSDSNDIWELTPGCNSTRLHDPAGRRIQHATRPSVLDTPYIISPAPATPPTVLSGANVTFAWNAGSGVSAYMLDAGTTGPGSSDVYSGSSTTATSAAVAVPTRGVSLYVRLSYEVNGNWQYNDYVYTEAGSATAPYMTSPSPGPPQTVLTGSNVTFTWNPGSGNLMFKLEVGTTGPGAYDVYSSAKGTTATSIPVTVPTTGANLYVRIYYDLNGAWQKVDYVYTQAP